MSTLKNSLLFLGGCVTGLAAAAGIGYYYTKQDEAARCSDPDYDDTEMDGANLGEVFGDFQQKMEERAEFLEDFLEKTTDCAKSAAETVKDVATEVAAKVSAEVSDKDAAEPDAALNEKMSDTDRTDEEPDGSAVFA